MKKLGFVLPALSMAGIASFIAVGSFFVSCKEKTMYINQVVANAVPTVSGTFKMVYNVTTQKSTSSVVCEVTGGTDPAVTTIAVVDNFGTGISSDISCTAGASTTVTVSCRFAEADNQNSIAVRGNTQTFTCPA